MTKRKPKLNEQTPDAGGGGYAGEARGGFDPLMGWTTAVGVGIAGLAYAKTKAPYMKQPKVGKNTSWTTQEQSDYYAGQAAALERTVQQMNHPSYYSKFFKMNEQDEMFTKIEQIRMMNEAERLRSRANFLSPQRSRKK